MDLKDFHLLGHSFGGFLVTSYALKYPERIKKLILAAPVGIAPWNISLDSKFKKFLSIFFFDLSFTPQSILRGFPFSKKLWENIGEKAKYRGLDKESWNYLYYK
jgi:pimeloyl-ACP methyl ester carboxylesterase